MDVFCKIIEGSIPSIKCYEDEKVIAIMDINPVAPGHLMVIPKNHVENILDMSDENIISVHNVATSLIKKMETNYPNIKGIKIVVNYGDLQDVKHYHMHLIPSYSVKPTLTQEELCNLIK